MFSKIFYSTAKKPPFFPFQLFQRRVVKAPSSQSRNLAATITGRIGSQNQDWAHHPRTLPTQRSCGKRLQKSRGFPSKIMFCCLFFFRKYLGTIAEKGKRVWPYHEICIIAMRCCIHTIIIVLGMFRPFNVTMQTQPLPYNLEFCRIPQNKTSLYASI